MEWFRVHSLKAGSVDVQAENWLTALGAGLGKLGLVQDLTSIACETLANGHILVRDARSGAGYSVVAIGGELGEQDEPTGEADLAAIPDDAIYGTVGLEDYVDDIEAAPDAAEAVRRTLGALRELAPSEAGAVLRRHSDGWLGFEGAYGPGADRLAGIVIPPSVGVAGFSVQRRIAVSLRDAYADPRFFKQIDAFTGYTTRSLLCLPMVIESMAYGCVQLLNAPNVGGFTRDAISDADGIVGALAKRLSQEPIPTPPNAKKPF
ncbi:MAG: GAF domain-containing protein [Pseudomonadota bacterium]|nr:GAF domain-containing protein [Pseudomonadota bacterium]